MEFNVYKEDDYQGQEDKGKCNLPPAEFKKPVHGLLQVTVVGGTRLGKQYNKYTNSQLCAELVLMPYNSVTI